MTEPTQLHHKLTIAIKPFVHPAAVAQVVQWIVDHKIILTITEKRHSVHGDYRHPDYSKGHRISVNGSLNKHAFLVTFVHEMAHLTCWLKNRNRVKPHGNEWKQEFRIMMQPFMKDEILPHDLQNALTQYLVNPAASGCVDDNLTRTLAAYDAKKSFTIEQLPHNAVFKIHNGRVFQKGERIRKRYRCVELKTKYVYLFSPVAEVLPQEVSG